MTVKRERIKKYILLYLRVHGPSISKEIAYGGRYSTLEIAAVAKSLTKELKKKYITIEGDECILWSLSI